MTHEMNARSPAPAGDGLLTTWAAELDELGEIGFESACPALQALQWREAAAGVGALGGAPVGAAVERS